MGNKGSVFDTETLAVYQECTFFTEKKIRQLYKRFSALNPQKIDKYKADTHSRLSFTEVQRLPELKANPFKDQICRVFATDARGMSFEDFLDMCNVFSESAPWELKAAYAFRIYDFDFDAFLSRDDMEETLINLTDDRLTDQEIKIIVEFLIQEVDIDQDDKLSYVEFEHVLSKSPEFSSLFHMSI